MNSTQRMLIAGFVAVSLVVTLMSCIYVVDEREQVLLTLFGEVTHYETEAGLHFKGPFLWEVERFPKLILEWDGEPSQIPTRDKKFIYVDTFARWRIVDLDTFFESVRSETIAQSRLDDRLDGFVRDVVTNHDLIEVVRNSNRELVQIEEGYGLDAESTENAIEVGRAKLATDVLALAAPAVRQEFGIELLDLQFKRINYIPSVQKTVFDRMISERRRIAELFRAEGKKAAAEIRGQQERELARINSEAYKIAQETKGAADAEATRIYADAFGRDKEFYSFVRSLESYRSSIGPGDTIVLDTDGDYFRYLEEAD